MKTEENGNDVKPSRSIKQEKVVKKAAMDDPSNNPYLSHWKEEEDGAKFRNGFLGSHPPGSALEKFERRNTTAKQAFDAENSDNNPFTGQPHSQKYFGILKSRRDLPVHKQRLVYLFLSASLILC